MNNWFDDLTDFATDAALAWFAFWILAGVFVVIGAVLWGLILAVYWLGAIIWHGGREIIRCWRSSRGGGKRSEPTLLPPPV